MSSSNENKNDISNIQVVMIADMPDSDSDDELPDLVPEEILENVSEDVSEDVKSNMVESVEEKTIIEEPIEGKDENIDENNDESPPPLEDIEDDSEPENDENDMTNSEPGECPFGADCPVKVAMDNNISPSHVRGDPAIRDHIDTYHNHLNFLFSRQYSQMRGEIDLIRFVLNASGIINGGMINGRIINAGNMPMMEEKEPANTKCNICKNYYDHDEHAPFYMSCCATSYCIKCVKELKTDEKKGSKCPTCENSLEYLNDIKILNKKKTIGKNSEDCLICCDTMNSTQYNGKVTLDCNCNFELCISCAYKSLKDTKHVKMGSVQGIEGLVLPQHYTVKGACPNCRQVPSNKEEIISLYGFLPPRR